MQSTNIIFLSSFLILFLFLGNLKGNGNDKHRSNSHLTCHFNTSIHLLNQAFSDRHSQTGSLINTTGICFFLWERIKNMTQELRTHPYTCIRNRPSVCTDSIMYICRLHYRSNLSSRPVILNTVSIDVQKNLAKMQWASIDIRIRDILLIFLINPLNILICCLVSDNTLNLIDQIFETDIFMSQNNMTFLYFTHLQNIIDKGKQIIRCYLHLFMIFLYQFLILKMSLVNL